MKTPYAQAHPYSASKASSDHLVRAWRRTYGLPTLITNCSNNYGPYHFPEKLIPLVILNALEDKALKGHILNSYIMRISTSFVETLASLCTPTEA